MLLLLATPARSAVDPLARVNVGVLGLEGIHCWPIPPKLRARAAALGWGSELRVNDRTAPLPRLKVTRISGLGSKAESEDIHDQAFGADREVPRATVLGGKTVVYEGELEAATLEQFRLARALAVAVFAPRVVRTMRVKPHRRYASGTEHAYDGRAEAFDCDDVQDAAPTRQPSPFVREFTLGIRQHDPRYFQRGIHVTGPAPSIVAHNDGTAPTDPVLTVDGPAPAEWAVTRDGDDGGRILTFRLPIAAGDRVAIDFAARTAIRQSDGVDLAGALRAPASNWWNAGVAGLEPGDNTVATTAAAVTATWKDASY